MSTLNKRFSLFFYLKKQNNQKKDHAVYLRLTVDTKRAEICTKRKWKPFRWDNAAGRAKGTKEDARVLNAFLDLLQTKVYEAHHEIISRGKAVSAGLIKNIVSGIGDKQHMLLEVVGQHNKEIFQLIGKGYCMATWSKYETTLAHLRNFLQWKHGLSDINIRDIRYSFVTDLDHYLRSEKDLDINTAGKYIKNLKKIINGCLAKGWLERDPFFGFKVKHKDVEIPHLSPDELKTLEEKEFSDDKLSQARDMFLFSCYTGLAYVDSTKLTAANIEIGIDGKKWLSKNRQKTNVPSRVPLLPQALAIIEKYRNHPKVCSSGNVLPMMPNKKVNSCLKEITGACGFKKKITFHVARHTFATTVTLGNGVPIDSVSKMLGHKKISTTQIYAKILDNKVSADMAILRLKMVAVGGQRK